MHLATIILAAGKGKRMKSNLPKVLHPLNDRAMIHYVIDVAKTIGSDKIVLIVGHKKELVMEETKGRGVEYVAQEIQLGTGHAVRQTESLFYNYGGYVLVLSGDVPLLTTQTLQQLIAIQQKKKPLVSMLTAVMDDPTGYGRVVRNSSGYVRQIVEQEDADPEVLKIKEVNVGIYIFKAFELFETLPMVKNENKQGEYYLPDVVKIFVDRGEKVVAVLAPDAEETHGINDVDQLKRAEKVLLHQLEE